MDNISESNKTLHILIFELHNKIDQKYYPKATIFI